jgi:hypothetical protein
MSESMNLSCAEFNLPLAAGTIPLMYIPPQAGGVQLLSVYLNPFIAGTVASFTLVKMTKAGTPLISGTIGTITTAQGTLVAYAPVALTLGTTFVDPSTTGVWIGAAYPTGLIAQAQLEISYVMGR